MKTMSTRGCYRFTDGSIYGPFTVYKHSDNYPYTMAEGTLDDMLAHFKEWPDEDSAA